jgi:XXXCH domain-containing protein
MSSGEAAEFLRGVASALENPEEAEAPSGQDLQGFQKISIGIKQHAGHVYLKMKVKSREPGGPGAGFAEASSGAAEAAEGVERAGEAAASAVPAEPPGDYKDLKKRMKESFKTIFKDLHAGVLPSAVAVREFLADAETMCKYRDKGDEYYPEFREACKRFREAFEMGDFPSCQSRCLDLNDIKTRCHADYK